jgi:purine-nucleoside/S-methyl-5'-thioadenosine phosphorylase / adenosine deaminase
MVQTVSARRPDAAVFRGSGSTRRIEVPILADVPGLVHLFTVKGSHPAAALAEAAGRDVPLRTLRQVHGAIVRTADPSARHDAGNAATREEGDALVVTASGLAVGVWVADCLPILICDPVTRAAAAVHAGWRGTVAGIMGAAIGALVRDRGATPGDLLVAMGPSIGPCCFEVGDEVVTALLSACPEAGSSVRPGPRKRVDLVEANRIQARVAGVSESRIQAAGLCTSCRPDLFESYRRDREAAGRMAAILAWGD